MLNNFVRTKLTILSDMSLQYLYNLYNFHCEYHVFYYQYFYFQCLLYVPKFYISLLWILLRIKEISSSYKKYEFCFNILMGYGSKIHLQFIFLYTIYHLCIVFM